MSEVVTKYNFYRIAEQYCRDRMTECRENHDWNMVTFFANAAKGFYDKAMNLSLSESQQPIWGC